MRLVPFSIEFEYDSSYGRKILKITFCIKFLLLIEFLKFSIFQYYINIFKYKSL